MIAPPKLLMHLPFCSEKQKGFLFQGPAMSLQQSLSPPQFGQHCFTEWDRDPCLKTPSTEWKTWMRKYQSKPLTMKFQCHLRLPGNSLRCPHLSTSSVEEQRQWRQTSQLLSRLMARHFWMFVPGSNLTINRFF